MYLWKRNLKVTPVNDGKYLVLHNSSIVLFLLPIHVSRTLLDERLADQSIIIQKKGLFFDFEILEICGQVNSEEYEPELKH